MTGFVESFLWCAVQVTLFSLFAVAVYIVVARRAVGLVMAVLLGSLGTVGLLTLLLLIPPSHWHWDLPAGWNPPWAVVATDDVSSELKTRSTVAELESVPFELPPADIPLPALTDAELIELANADLDATSFVDDAAMPMDVVALAESEEESEPESVAAPAWSLDRSDWQLIVTVCLSLTIGLGTLRIAIAFVVLRRYRTSSRRVADPGLLWMADSIADSLGLTDEVVLRESPHVSSPATIGWRNPIVLLPKDWREWSPAERAAVLAHELAHVRLRHYPAWLFGQLVLVPHYYHPLLHWLVGRLRLEQELAADDYACRALGDHGQYAVALATLALRPTAATAHRCSLGLFMSHALLTRRIEMLRQPVARIANRRTTLRLLVLALLMAVGLAASGIRMPNQSQVIAAEPTADAEPVVEADVVADADVVIDEVLDVEVSKPDVHVDELDDLNVNVDVQVDERINANVDTHVDAIASDLHVGAQRASAEMRHAELQLARLAAQADQLRAAAKSNGSDDRLDIDPQLQKIHHEMMQLQKRIYEIQMAQRGIKIEAAVEKAIAKEMAQAAAEVERAETKSLAEVVQQLQVENRMLQAKLQEQAEAHKKAREQILLQWEELQKNAREAEGRQKDLQKLREKELKRLQKQDEQPPVDTEALGTPPVKLRMMPGNRLTIATTRQSKKPTHQVTALFRVSYDDPGSMEIARKTQLALLKSAFVLQAAIRDPAISELEVVAIQPDPLAWLANRLQTEFIQGSEILQLRMVCAEDEVEEYRKVVDAVANAYQEQVVFAGRNQQLAVRDTLRKQLAKLNGELRRKMEDYNALAKDLGALDGESQVGQQLNMARIERIESEILRLENEALLHELRGEEGKEAEVQSKYFETRLTRLAEQRAQLEEQMKGAMEPSVELNLRRTEIEQLQEVARDVAMRIERLDLQSQHSNPIVKIQDAAASRLSDSDQQVLNVIRVPGGLK